MFKPIYALPFCVPALLAAQLFSAAFEVQAVTLTVDRPRLQPNGQLNAIAPSISIGTDDTFIISRSGSITIDSRTSLFGRPAIAVLINAGATGYTILNNGRITTNRSGSAGAHGIRARSSGNITNNGAITTNQTGSYGILADNANDTITNSGTIRTNGTTSHGIRAGNNNLNITNSGAILTDAAGSRGMLVGNGNTINNSGAITSATGIEAGSNNTINNSGNIVVPDRTPTSTTDAGAATAIYIRGTGNILHNTGIITSATGRAVHGPATASITTLSNTVTAGKPRTGTIQGNTDGIHIGFIGSLTNNAGAVIEGKGGAGVMLTRTTAGTASVSNSGTIKGTTYGLDYGAHTISTLTNSGTIEGVTEAGVRATAITELDNKAGGKITSRDSDGVRTTGTSIGTLTNAGEISGGRDGVSTSSLTTLTNSGTISGGRHGVSAVSLATLTNSGTIEGKEGAGITLSGTTASRITITNSGTIKGTTFGLDYGTNTIASLKNTGSGLIQGGTGAGLRAGDITELENALNAKIVSTSTTTRRDGVLSSGAIGTLTNRGEISGGRHGVSAQSLATLSNSGTIEGKQGAGITLSGTTTSSITITNSGTIKGTTFGLDYGTNTIASLKNTGSGLIQGGTGAGLRAGDITELENALNAKIVSTSTTTRRDGVLSSGAIGTLTNRGEISGGRHGVSAQSLATLSNSGTIEGKQGAGVVFRGVTGTGAITNSGTIKGTTFGLQYTSKTISSLRNTGAGLIQGGSRAGVEAGTITVLENDTRARILSTSEDGVISDRFAMTRLTNRGTIDGGRHGVQAVSIGTLINHGTIRGRARHGVSLNSANIGTVLNSGTIRGAMLGLRYTGGRIDSLENTGTGLIQGGSDAGVLAATITELENDARSRIISTGNDGVRVTSTIGTLTNDGEISGGRHGVNAPTVGLTNSGDITGGTSGASTATDRHALKLGLGNSTVVNTGKITSGKGRGISGELTTVITTLSNTVNSSRAGTGVIKGSTDGIRVGFITSLTNNAGAVIEGEAGAGVALTRTTPIGTATVSNSGRIEGATFGLDYGVHTISQLTNNDGGRILGGTEAAVRAGAITRLDNNAGGRIISTSNDGVRVAGAIGTLNNSDTISGGRHGVNALTVGLTNSGDITGGTSGALDATDRHALKLGAGNSTVVNTGKITSAKGRGISGELTTVITTLSNTVNPLRAGTGVIEGSTDGIRVGFITSLTNNAGAVIEGEAGAGVALTRTPAAGTANVTNRGTIQGETYGLDYGTNTISRLRNLGSGLIRGNSRAGIRAGEITELVNDNSARIGSRDGTGILSSGAIRSLTNRGIITGGWYGISAVSVGLTNSGSILGGTRSVGGDQAALRLTGAGSRITNRGRIIADRGDGIGGGAASAIISLTNEVVSTIPNGGLIRGNRAGIQVGFIGDLTNNAGATIRGMTGAGITLVGVAGTSTATVSNSGTIQGATDGLNYGAHTISRLSNSGTGLIQGGTGGAVTAGDITALENDTRARIQSTDGAGISSSGAIGTLTNRGRITSTNDDGINSRGAIGTLDNSGIIAGGRVGVSAAAVGLTNTGFIYGGTQRLVIGDKAALGLTGAGSEIINRGQMIADQGDGIGGGAASAIISLTNETRAGVAGSGLIRGDRAGIRVGFIGNLTNNAGAIIQGRTGGGITLTGTSTNNATVINHGTIQGATHGMDYGQNTIASLTNTSANSIRGGTGDALRAFAMLKMMNSGAIVSTGAGGITLTGTASGASYTNSALIEGKTHGLDYGNNAIARLDNTPTGILRGTDGPAIKGRTSLNLHNRGRVEGKTGVLVERPTTGADRDVTIDNYGILRSLDSGAGTAIELRGLGRDTLRYQTGSRLAGLMSWDGAGDTFFYAPGTPAIFSFRDNNTAPNGAPDLFNVIAPAQRTILRSTRRSPRPGEGRVTVAFIDASLYTLTDSTFSRWTGAVSEALAQQVRSEYSNGEGRMLWLRPFSGYQSFSDDGPRPAARYDYVGGLAGISTQSGLARFGFFGGAAVAKTEVSGRARDQQSDSFFAGAYLHGPVRQVHLHGALLAGQSQFQSGPWTQINNLAPGGQERVSVDYKSLFLSSQVGLLGGRFNLLGLGLHPAVQFRYLGRFTDDHGYQPERAGAPALFRIKRHDVHIGLLRAELRAPASLWKGRHSRLRGEMRLGAEGNMVLGGRKIPVQLGGGETAFKARGKHGAATGFIGAGLRYSVPGLNLTLSADIEGSYDTDAATSVWGQIGYEWEF